MLAVFPARTRGFASFSVADEVLGSAFFALGSICQHCGKGGIINKNKFEKMGGLGRLCNAGVWDPKGGAVCNSAE